VIGWMAAGSAAGEASWLADTPGPATSAHTGSFTEAGPGGTHRGTGGARLWQVLDRRRGMR